MKRADTRRSTGVGSPAPTDKRAAVAALADQGIEELAAALAAGKSDELERYLSMMGRFHRYSFNNCLLIAIQRPDATLVAGYGRWQDLGRQVRKGERGIAILAPCLRRVEVDGDVDEPDGGTTRVLTGFRVAYVFDVAQTDGEPLPEMACVAGDAVAAGAAVECQSSGYRGSPSHFVKADQAVKRMRRRRRLKLARPYIVRLISFNRLIWPSNCPLLHGRTIAASTAARSLSMPLAKRRSSMLGAAYTAPIHVAKPVESPPVINPTKRWQSS